MSEPRHTHDHYHESHIHQHTNNNSDDQCCSSDGKHSQHQFDGHGLNNHFDVHKDYGHDHIIDSRDKIDQLFSHGHNHEVMTQGEC